jgi:hypothetical protein
MANRHSGFHKQKNFSEKYPQFSKVPTLFRPKILNSISFMGGQIINETEGPKCLWPALNAAQKKQLFTLKLKANTR